MIKEYIRERESSHGLVTDVGTFTQLLPASDILPWLVVKLLPTRSFVVKRLMPRIPI